MKSVHIFFIVFCCIFYWLFGPEIAELYDGVGSLPQIFWLFWGMVGLYTLFSVLPGAFLAAGFGFLNLYGILSGIAFLLVCELILYSNSTVNSDVYSRIGGYLETLEASGAMSLVFVVLSLSALLKKYTSGFDAVDYLR